MSFLGSFSRNKRAEAVVLVDVSTTSVAGAYALYAEGHQPVMLYARRVPVEERKSEPIEASMMRALQVLGETLIREGAPILSRAIGSGSADTILVSIDSPWQATSVRTEHIEDTAPFTFTKSMVIGLLQKTSVVPPEKFLADESIIGTILNGYETRDPYGKSVRRASVVVLTSLVDKKAAESIVGALRGFFHTKRVLPIASNSLRFQAMRAAFPHEGDALILDATGPYVAIALLRRGLFVAVSSIAESAVNTASWKAKVGSALEKLAEQYPLPRTIFLLAEESDAPPLREVLDSADLGTFWLSDNPPTIVSVLPSHLSALVEQASSGPPDLSLFLMALYYRHRSAD